MHHLVPNILTCLVAKRLADANTPPPPNDIRVYAAQLVSHICTTYGDAYPTLVPRITKTLLRAFLDPSKSLGCRYGSIVGLEGLGSQVTRRVVLPNLKAFGEEMKGIMGQGDALLTADAQACVHAVEV